MPPPNTNASLITTTLTYIWSWTGFLPPPKPDPERIFRTRGMDGRFVVGPQVRYDEHAAFAEHILHTEDVHDHLRELCLRHEHPQYVDALKRAFYSDAIVLGASRGRYWTSTTFASLLERDENWIPGVSEAAELLWRLLRAVSAFPFAKDDSSDTLDCDSYLTAYAVLLRGRSVLCVPGYRVRKPGGVGRISRRREPLEWTSLVFESLAKYSADESDAGASSPIEDSIDLVDVMAACLDAEEDKQAWQAGDFERAVAPFPEARLKQLLRGRMDRLDFLLLMRLAVSIRNTRDHDVDKPKSPPSSHIDGEALYTLLETLDVAKGGDVSWQLFAEVVEEHMPDLYDMLSKYLLHVFASAVPQRQGRRFVYRMTQAVAQAV